MREVGNCNEVGHLSPNILARYSATMGDCLWVGTSLAILSPGGLSIPIVLVKSITGHGVIYCLWSVPWVLVHLGHNFQHAPLLCPGKYLFICNFLSNSLLHTNKSPLPLPCILCEVSNALAILPTQPIFPKISKCVKVVFTVVPCCLCNFCSCTC